MQANYISPLTERPLVIEHLVSLYRNQLNATQTPFSSDTVNNYYSIVFVESGTALVTISERSFTIESGSIIVIPPNQFHLIRSADSATVTYIYASLDISSDLIKNIPTRPFRCQADDYSYLLTAIDNLESAVNNLKNEDKIFDSLSKDSKIAINMQVVYNCIELFLLILCSKTQAEPVKESHKQTRHANITSSVEAYLKARVRENISLQETAQHFGYSVSNIQKIFKAVTGQSIIVYFNHLKLEEAKRLIIENNMTFSQISGYLSFSNPNYFSRIFKTTVGMTPTEYANLYQKNPVDNTSSKKSKTSPHSSKRVAKQ